ncbi:hypothetical protein AJ80_03267 [Polytolypa hystricis UAMH7299]|uniref:Peroxin-22-like protein Pex22-like-Penicillium chrysogenum n=1 Tax=Polytolypa hystricis (strain UAMH7299) TaxID=1447883 RepID=A0A2B7YIT3_POLH7|nr:hypothetical protein AJ80_03267 [Polytolypa hystricis UAMH7299]
MSNNYFQDSRRRARGPTGFSTSGNRSALGYWLPLAVTVTTATIGLAAWVWSERKGNDSDDEEGDEYHRRHDNTSGRVAGGPGPEYGAQSEGYMRATGSDVHARGEDTGVLSRFQDALRRTPSPQQLFDGASRRVAAGISAVGGALTSIQEEDRGGFEDHSRWTEEADSRAAAAVTAAEQRSMSGGIIAPSIPPPAAQAAAAKKRKTVAIVISSVAPSVDASEESHPSEHASILSHLPEYVDADTARVFVLIYAPNLSPRTGTGSGSETRPPLSINSSYSNIEPEEAAAAAAEGSAGDLSTLEPRPAGSPDTFDSASPFFRTQYTQAQSLVDKDTMIMPFNTANGYVHILRHLAPEIVYVQEGLAGEQGGAVQQISGWVRQVVIVVGGEAGGLVDSDDDDAATATAVSTEKGSKWWQEEGVTGLGKRIAVVEGVRMGEDWKRRVSGHE